MRKDLAKYMTVAEVAEVLGVTTEVVYRRIRDDRLQAKPFGKRGYQVLRTEVDRWLRDEQRTANAKWQERIDAFRAAS